MCDVILGGATEDPGGVTDSTIVSGLFLSSRVNII